MQNKHRFLFSFLLILVIFTLLYGGGSYYFTEHFFPNTYINDIDVSFLSEEKAREKLSTDGRPESIELIKNDGSSESLELSDLDHRREYESPAYLIEAQDNFKWPLYILEDKKVNLAYENIIDESKLRKLISDLDFIKAEQEAPQDAYILRNEESREYYIVDEIYGNTVLEEEFFNVLKKYITEYKTSLSLEDEGLYMYPEIRADNEYLIAKTALLNKLNSINAELDLSAELKIRIDTDELFSFYKDPVNGDYSLNEENISAYLDSISLRYDTVSESGYRLFNSAAGRTVNIKTKYGWKLDKLKTAELLRGSLNEIAVKLGEDLSEPYSFIINAVWESAAHSHKPRDIGDTYAEVDITNQTVYMIKDKQLVFTSPCVTGLLTAGRRTPDGIYSITYKQPGKVLTGRNPDGTISYQSPVSFWMPFNRGIGFHDATWRNKFGGEIYKRNGSHGCINMPYNKAKELYQLVYTSMPVVCYF
ncbi:MAG: L,D-transpeptidase [Eubacteriales bacterium]|nr:L,D-transpeptidase [Eubacteriales bacterium]